MKPNIDDHILEVVETLEELRNQKGKTLAMKIELHILQIRGTNNPRGLAKIFV